VRGVAKAAIRVPISSSVNLSRIVGHLLSIPTIADFRSALGPVVGFEAPQGWGAPDKRPARRMLGDSFFRLTLTLELNRCTSKSASRLSKIGC
jgi:hypothetical protein